MPSWLPDVMASWLPWVFAASVAMFVGSLIALPIVVARLPRDFFLRSSSAESVERHPVMHVVWVIVRNVVGAVFVVAGFAMLVLPGQGILTIVLGLFLIDLPGKRALEHRLIRVRAVQRGLNWLRARVHREPLRFPEGYS